MNLYNKIAIIIFLILATISMFLNYQNILIFDIGMIIIFQIDDIREKLGCE